VRGANCQPTRVSGNWEFRRHRHIGIKNPETTRSDQDRPLLGWVAVIGAIEKSPNRRSSIGPSWIGKSQILWTKYPCIMKSRNAISRWSRDNGAHGRVSSGQVAYCIVNRDIVSFVDKVSIHYEIANPESPTYLT
jgi:hypothetical protein